MKATKTGLKLNEPWFVDFEVSQNWLKGQTIILAYKLPIYDVTKAVDLAKKYFLLNDRSILTVLVYKRKESIYGKHSRVNYVLHQRIDQTQNFPIDYLKYSPLKIQK